ncbi:hypothetical protein [Propionivibrio dicarboxylicus]|uniref:Uncharacterized protein n=1 Tax=Propionivibrio dicarboxylicus TaxID=83767 RepID=A0A1G8FVM3_9RHOO|nr:hypothetical protein [Propionivibrio dicarboxylicus]SDH86199.1 hypothetical protein SAMN05660652_02443 [Propionivibrio dicarboxylicus]
MQELEIQVTPNTRPVGKLLAEVASTRQAEIIRKKLATEELAAALRVAPQTIRAGLCRKGHYCGLRPLKLPTGKLLWDASEVERLLSAEGSV